MNWYHEAAYNNITGDWEPETWSKNQESDETMSYWHYPPYNPSGSDWHHFRETTPNSVTNIGKGHLFSGYIEHYHSGDSTITSGLYEIYGRSKNLDEAKTEAKKYEDLHNATYHASDEDGLVSSYHEPIHDKHGNQIGVSWIQTHHIPIDSHKDEDNTNFIKEHIENIHKFLYDRNNNTRGGQKPMFSSMNWYDR